MIYGYARISTPRQNIDRQIRNIKKAFPESLIIRETYTGTTIDRKEWNKLQAKVTKGDTIVFDSVSRMSRDAQEGFAAYQYLYNMGVNLVFLKEPHINTDTYKTALTSYTLPETGTAVDIVLKAIEDFIKEITKEQIRIAFEQSEKEVSDMRQRTKEGIETARLNNKQIGQKQGNKLTTKKSIAAKKVIKKHARAFGGTLSDIEVMRLAEISRNTYYKYKRELKNDLQ
jgi:DNA invertase Pin-like site-specific DNA recombinase